MPTTIGRPVPSLDIQFEWHTGLWEQIFDLHVEFIQQDILRNLAAERLVIYLSCPISSRGGSISITNVEIADATARRLTTTWGARFWFLNPAQYQLESKQGTGLIRRHARWIEVNTGTPVDVDALMRDTPPTGGDYMRMWTRVLAEDLKDNLGERFSAYYFIGPSDYHNFFTQGGQTDLNAAVEDYFARKSATDLDFNTFYSPPFWDEHGNLIPPDKEKEEWEIRRREFIRFYTLKAGVYFSKGSHDEWNIWAELNSKRMTKYGIGRQIPGYFDGAQIPPGAAETQIVPGYAVPSAPAIPLALPELEEGSEATSHEVALTALINHTSPTFLGADGADGGASFAAGAELTLPGGTMFESFFWGISRHKVIAGAADRQLSRRARAEVARILAPISVGSLEEVAGWADEVKRRRPQPGDDQETVDFLSDDRNRSNDQWHYVDIPIGASRYSQHPEFTRVEDVVHILSEAIRVLINRSNRFSKVNALRLVSHLVGDVHQPLHVGCGYIDATGHLARLVSDPDEIIANGFESDSGGNDLILPIGAEGTSLHSYWDSRLGGTISLFGGAPADPAPQALANEAGDAKLRETNLRDAESRNTEIKRFERAFVNRLVRMIPSGRVAGLTPAGAFNATAVDQLPEIWADETLRVAATAYESLRITGVHQTRPKVKYDVVFEGGRAAYDTRCRPLVRQQMQLAAQNLAMLINRIFP